MRSYTISYERAVCMASCGSPGNPPAWFPKPQPTNRSQRAKQPFSSFPWRPPILGGLAAPQAPLLPLVAPAYRHSRPLQTAHTIAMIRTCTVAIVHARTTAIVHACTRALAIVQACVTAIVHVCTVAIVHACTTAIVDACTITIILACTL